MKVIDGNSACANMAYNLSEMAFIYPITPSSPMASQIDNLHNNGVKNIFNDTVNVVEMQSEAGAAGALHGALSAGILATTFTSSQGLLLMIPNMYKIAGEGLPAVIHVASRSIATHALSIFGDHQDIYATRMTGFNILASSNVQDVEIMTLLAHLSAIKGSMPFLHFFDGFRTSHEYNQINEIDKSIINELVDYEAINNFRNKALNSNKAITKGTNQNEDIYFQSYEARRTDYKNISLIVNNYMEEINKKLGTNYKPFNYYGPDNAKYIIIAMGSVCDTIKSVVNLSTNTEFGLIEVHLYRPFNTDFLLNVIPKSTTRIAVLDRTSELGSNGEPLYLDVLESLKYTNIDIYHGRYGLSSKNTSPSDIYNVFMNLKDANQKEFVIGIDDDINHNSLPKYDFTMINNYQEFKIYGFGSDGMVSASKNILKILSNDNYVQGYFEYDSKKSGGVTISHLRLSNQLIEAPYYVTKPILIAITKDEYFYKFDMLEGLKDSGILLVNTNRNESDFNRFLPDKIKKELKRKKINVYLINADTLAKENNLNGKISLIMESAILSLLNINNFEDLLINDVKERFSTKGSHIVEANINVIKNFNTVLNKITIDDNEGIILKEPDTYEEIITSRKGNNLKVSDLVKYKNGTFAGGTSKLEKRKMSYLVPIWNKEKCIQCGLCSIYCPHAVIRPFIVDNNDKYAYLGKDTKDDHKYIMMVSHADCTGCGLCIKNCPTNALNFGSYDDNNQIICNDMFDNYSNPNNEIKTIKDISLRKPLFEFSGACAGCGETAYIKILTQIIGQKLIIANATGCSSIYGGPEVGSPYNVSWANSLFEDNAEFAFGMIHSYNKLRLRVLNDLKNNIPKSELYDKIKEVYNNYDKMLEIKPLLDKYVREDLRDYILPKSVWAIGGDGWAYDIGFGGIDHVLASNQNINILVLDTEVYSNTGGQSSKSTRIGAVAEFASSGKNTNKKDLFKIAMTYPNVYIASISLGANPMHTINAIKEAEEHNGPSIIIAYAPCIEHGIKGGMINSINSEKLAVECGYIILMRYNNGNLTIDSSKPNFDKYDEFLNNETRYNALKIKNIDLANELLQLNKENAINRYNYYNNLINK